MKIKWYKNKFLLFIFISIALHIFFLISTINYTFFNENIEDTKITPIEFITPIDTDNSKKQIVDRDDNANKVKPKTSKYLSAHDNNVEKQTRSKDIGKLLKDNTLGNGLKYSNKNANMTPQFKIDPFATEDLPKLENLRVKEEDIGNLRLPESSDYLPDVKEADRTQLNTREFVFFSYFERIKKRIGMFWTPALEEKFRKLYFANIQIENRDIITKLAVVLDKNGNIKKIEKLSSSGYKDLDNAAIEAFERAAPFVNPPQGILDDDNNIIITWDFILKAQVSTINFIVSKL